MDAGRQYALIAEQWKYLHFTNAPDELYNLQDDPHELTNVIGRFPGVAQRMRRRLLERLAAYENMESGERAPNSYRPAIWKSCEAWATSTSQPRHTPV